MERVWRKQGSDWRVRRGKDIIQYLVWMVTREKGGEWRLSHDEKRARTAVV